MQICMICRQELPDDTKTCPNCGATPCVMPEHFLNQEQHQEFMRVYYYPQLERWKAQQSREAELNALRDQVAALQKQNETLRNQPAPAQPDTSQEQLNAILEQNRLLREQLEAMKQNQQQPEPEPAKSTPVQEDTPPEPEPSMDTAFFTPYFAAAGEDFCAYLQDGRVHLLGRFAEQYSDALYWSDIRMLAAGEQFLAGLKHDGTVLTAGGMFMGRNETDSWRNIRHIAANRTTLIAADDRNRLVTTGFPRMQNIIRDVFAEVSRSTAPICRMLLTDDRIAVLTKAGNVYHLYTHRMAFTMRTEERDFQCTYLPGMALTEDDAVILRDGILTGKGLPSDRSGIRWEGLTGSANRWHVNGFPDDGFPDDKFMNDGFSDDEFMNDGFMDDDSFGQMGSMYAERVRDIENSFHVIFGNGFRETGSRIDQMASRGRKIDSDFKSPLSQMFGTERNGLYVFTMDGSIGEIGGNSIRTFRLPMQDRNVRLLNLLPLENGHFLCQLLTRSGIVAADYQENRHTLTILNA